jgi:hypothetical protein
MPRPLRTDDPAQPLTLHTSLPIPAEAVTPAMCHFLMLGEPPTMWLHGWVDLEWRSIDVGYDMTQVRDRVWTPAVAAALEHEAARFGFVPWGVSQRRPRGPGITAWVTQFAAQYGRRD